MWEKNKARAETPWRSVALKTGADKRSKVFIKRFNLQVYHELQPIAPIVHISWNYCRYCHNLVIARFGARNETYECKINARNVIDRVPIPRLLHKKEKKKFSRTTKSKCSFICAAPSLSPSRSRKRFQTRFRSGFSVFPHRTPWSTTTRVLWTRWMHACERRDVYGNVDGTDCHWSAQEGDTERAAGGRSEAGRRRKDIKQTLRR